MGKYRWGRSSCRVLSNEGREREGRPRGKAAGGGGGERERLTDFHFCIPGIPNDIPTDRQADARDIHRTHLRV